jgi:hypothetical protein
MAGHIEQRRPELDAWYPALYRFALRYILDLADVKGPECSSESLRVLKKNELACRGEYRTAAYDQLTKHRLAAE